MSFLGIGETTLFSIGDKWRPVLFGTTTIEDAQYVGKMFLAEAVSYMEGEGYPREHIQAGVDNINRMIARQVRDLQEVGHARSEEERWSLVEQKYDANGTSTWHRALKIGGIVAVGVGGIWLGWQVLQRYF